MSHEEPSAELRYSPYVGVSPEPQVEAEQPIQVTEWEVGLDVTARPMPRFERPLLPTVKEPKLLDTAPWVRPLGKLTSTVMTQGWKFPTPLIEPIIPPKPEKSPEPRTPSEDVRSPVLPDTERPVRKPKIRTRPCPETVLLKDRLLYLLQPPLDNLFDGDQLSVPFEPFSYQLEGIAFLMPRHSAMLADEMGLGKTAQAILATRLLVQGGIVRRALLVCPKPLVFNWARELKLWAPDLPFEIISGSPDERRATWTVSNCPLKLINYETLTRDEEILKDETVAFDLVVLDEAQRIKNRGSRTAEVVCSIKRDRSWALTGTPIENRTEDLVNIFRFVDEGRIPPETPARMVPELTDGYILRRTKDIAQKDMPPRIYRDLCLELSPAQKEAYELAEKEGVVRLNEMGDTLKVQHVFQLVMRLKQICNFDPLTRDSSKLEQLITDMEEVAESGRKAIIFSQWVEPLFAIAEALKEFNPLQFHGKIPTAERPAVLDRFKEDPRHHVILMSYGTGSVGLNLQFCNYVFLFDRWWNPAIEDQAINRAHRVGQKNPVTITRFTTENTIEKRIADVLEAKRQLFNDMLAQNGPPPVMGLTEDEIFGLFDISARAKGKAA